MNFKYYDTLTQIIVGYLILVISIYAFGFTYTNAYNVPYLAGAFVIGYFINTISSLLEGFYYWTIGGMPSNKLLRINSQKKYSGISKVRFYHTAEVVAMLQHDLNDSDANERKMFSYAMTFSNSDEKCRVPDFNAHYAFSRVMLTTTLIITIILLFHFYDEWETYLVFILLILSWNRYRERGYYYAREVLNEYLKKKKTN
ncbi:MAG: hypothetical protein LBE13_06640 [Bacteroidales bacterium]|jgi:hypothetical protein|nr:hypothetical protein [Bacteroidales bacterium]